MTTSQSLQVRTKDGVKFGKQLREKKFLFQEGYLNLNHGMYAFVLLVFVLPNMHELMLSSRVWVLYLTSQFLTFEIHFVFSIRQETFTSQRSPPCWLYPATQGLTILNHNVMCFTNINVTAS